VENPGRPKHPSTCENKPLSPIHRAYYNSYQEKSLPVENGNGTDHKNHATKRRAAGEVPV